MKEEDFKKVFIQEDSEIGSDDVSMNYLISFLKKWKSIPSRNIQNYSQKMKAKPLSEEDFIFDHENNKLTLTIDTYTAVLIYEGHNFENPISGYISRISFEDKNGSMTFSNNYINFPFSYESDCKCTIWKIK
ncbi:hypothetical protein EHQ24_12050 [Leptospira noumeaensis]|uniref:Uncharacterized protein n=2 Tax=Leptospira noumeaensis TaxID=2484964 RepID=A0A4R9I956_9LEPT|nr:hypothetical protein EHQ24_12050 [Leptospira noumeaensis]